MDRSEVKRFGELPFYAIFTFVIENDDRGPKFLSAGPRWQKTGPIQLKMVGVRGGAYVVAGPELTTFTHCLTHRCGPQPSSALPAGVPGQIPSWVE